MKTQQTHYRDDQRRVALINYKILHLVPKVNYQRCRLALASDFVRDNLLDRLKETDSSTWRRSTNDWQLLRHCSRLMSHDMIIISSAGFKSVEGSTDFSASMSEGQVGSFIEQLAGMAEENLMTLIHPESFTLLSREVTWQWAVRTYTEKLMSLRTKR